MFSKKKKAEEVKEPTKLDPEETIKTIVDAIASYVDPAEHYLFVNIDHTGSWTLTIKVNA